MGSALVIFRLMRQDCRKWECLGAGAIKQFCGIIACNKYAGSAVVGAFLLVTPFWLHSGYGYFIFASIVVTALAATSLNLLLGYTGVLSLGHAAFFGVGAYACALVLRSPVHSTALAVLTGTIVGGTIGVLFSGLVSIVFGNLSQRWRLLSFAVCTLLFNQLCFYAAGRWKDLTGGLDGMPINGRGSINLGPFILDFSTQAASLYYFMLAIFAVGVAAMGLLLRSRFGRALTAIRDDTRDASLGGFGVKRSIWLCFSVSSFFTALAGALYALEVGFVEPGVLHYSRSFEFVIMAVLGGMRTFWGPVVGAMLVALLHNFAMSNQISMSWYVFDGVLAVPTILLMPFGLVPSTRHFIDWIRRANWRRPSVGPATRRQELSSWYAMSRESATPGFLKPYEAYLIKVPRWWKALRAVAVAMLVLLVVTFGLFGLIVLGVLHRVSAPDFVAGGDLTFQFLDGSITAFCFLLITSFLAKDGAAALQNDTRRPVLYLRSFKSDESVWRGWVDYYFKNGTAEGALVRVMRAIGPVVALGPPGEKLPPFGAARFHIGHDNWQSLVKAVEVEAALVVLRIGLTESFWWEVKYLTETSAPEKIVIYLPPQDHREVYSQFCSKVNDILPKPLPARLADNALIVSFGPDWSPRQTDVDGPSMKATMRRKLLAGTTAPAIHEALVQAGYLEGTVAFSVREWIMLAVWTVGIASSLAPILSLALSSL